VPRARLRREYYRHRALRGVHRRLIRVDPAPCLDARVVAIDGWQAGFFRGIECSENASFCTVLYRATPRPFEAMMRPSFEIGRSHYRGNRTAPLLSCIK
jgi:hypothetical protein